MSNNTNLIITCYDEDDVVAEISEQTGINFRKMSDGNKAGGPKVLVLESFGACYQSLGRNQIQEIIEVFRSVNFTFPELAVLIISDDDDETLGGVITLEP